MGKKIDLIPSSETVNCWKSVGNYVILLKQETTPSCGHPSTGGEFRELNSKFNYDNYERT